MKAFASLLDHLTYAPQRTTKLRLMADYFRTTPDPDRGIALAALTDSLTIRWPVRRVLADLVATRVDPELYRLSRDYVGDTAETVALIWPEPDKSPTKVPDDIAAPSRLADIVAALMDATPATRVPVLAAQLDSLDATGRWATLKLLTGAPRVGVSARLAKTALADAFGRDVAEIEEIWHGLKPPYAELFDWLEGRADRPDSSGAPVFRPMMLAHPLDDGERDTLVLSDLAVEWKWDGIRVQLAASGGNARLYSRTGEDIGDAFPDIIMHANFNAVLDGELLVVRDGVIAPFSDLQQRLNRKSVTPKMLKDYPAHIRLYDALAFDGEDLRPLPFFERRTRLERWASAAARPRMDLSEIVAISSHAHLEDLQRKARESGLEGLMLKRRESPYIAGRPKGHWWKWKRDALTADCVLMYAQRGSGKRSSLHSDLTFGCWRDGEGGLPELVPVGKAYSGFTDNELTRLDRWVRDNTTDRFGPVRAVTPGLVLEIAFDALSRSARHKSGVAMRFPRIHRIRWDKPPAEADWLASLEQNLECAAKTSE